jgi:hypothetical protein
MSGWNRERPAGACGERGRPAKSAWFLWILPALGAVLRPPLSAEELFVDVTERAGIHFQHQTGAAGKKFLYETMIGGAGWLDFDGDGYLDLYLVQGHSDSEHPYQPGKETDLLYRNKGDGTFEDVTERAGLGDRRYGSGLAVGDIDNDGHPDLYVTNVGQSVLYRNNGNGTFSDITREAGVECGLWSTSAAFADINGDGLLDLYVANYLSFDPRIHGACTGNARRIPAYCHPNKFDGAPDRLYLNLGGGRFRDISRESGVAVAGRILGKGLGVLPTDYDGDGRVDFFIANDSVPNFLWHNLGGNRFEDVALEVGVALNSSGQATASMGIDGGDVNGDGLLDYFVTTFSEESAVLYLGQKDGFFIDGTARAGLAEPTYLPLGFGTRLFDYDLDGDLDIFIACGHILDNVEELYPGTKLRYAQTAQLLENDGRGRFRDVSASSGSWFQKPIVGRAAAFADFDNDGDLDIFIVSSGQRGVLLENRGPRGNHWVGLQLEGAGPVNRDAYGSRVDLKVSGRDIPIPLEIRSAASYQSANDSRQSVGLGKEGSAEWARVRWPDGRVELFRGLKKDLYNRIQYGRGEPAKS